MAEFSAFDFGSITTIHGLRYVLNRQTGYVAKFALSIWMAVLFILCIVLLSNIWSRWHSEPLIVSLTDKPEPIWEIPFPAITICPETKSKQRVFNLKRIYNILNHKKPNEEIAKSDL